MSVFENFDKQGPPDISLITEDGKRIICHKTVLMQESDYFKAMFGTNFAEKDLEEVVIQEVDGFILQKLISLNYAHYHDLKEDDALELIKTASMLQFTRIQEECARILQQEIKVENAIDFFILSDLLGITTLKKHSKSFILYNFDSVVKNLERFIKLPKVLLTSIISHPHLNCLEENQLAQAINSWVLDSVEKEVTFSSNCILDLFSHVHFGTLSLNQLNAISSLPAVQLSGTISEVINLMKWKKSGIELKTCPCFCHGEQESLFTNQKMCPNCLIHCFSNDPPPKDDKVCCISPVCFRTRNAPIHKEACRNSILESNDESELFRPPQTIRLIDHLLSLGERTLPSVPCVVGHFQEIRSNQLQARKKLKPNNSPVLLIYDLDGNNFYPLVQLEKVHEGPVEATGYKVCAVGKDIYIIGGEYLLGHSNWLKSVWKYDSIYSTWSVETSLELPRRHHSVCVADNFIYVIGGFGKHRIVLDSVERYDTIQCCWNRCASLNVPLYSSACCYYQGRIYVIGHQIYVYNPQSNEWGTVPLTKINSFNGDIVFSEAMPVAGHGIYLTSSRSSCLYLLDLTCLTEPKLELVGQFQNVVLNSCYVESKKCIVTFSTIYLDIDIPEESTATLVVEKFDVVKKSFSVSWKKSANSQIKDFGVRFSLGCFSLLHYL